MADANGDSSATLIGRRRGKCKWFNVAKGWGFITPNDGGPDVFVHQSVITMPGFRSLGDDEEIEFECKSSDKGMEATSVSGPEGDNCKGSHRRPMSKKRFRKIRCYNCGEFANHVAAKCSMGPQPKKCHNCKSVDHLIADCPCKDEIKKKKNNNNDNHCDNKNNDEQHLRHIVNDVTFKTIIANDSDIQFKTIIANEEDDEDVELHDHRINCSSSPASSCGTEL